MSESHTYSAACRCAIDCSDIMIFGFKILKKMLSTLAGDNLSVRHLREAFVGRKGVPDGIEEQNSWFCDIHGHFQVQRFGASRLVKGGL